MITYILLGLITVMVIFLNIKNELATSELEYDTKVIDVKINTLHEEIKSVEKIQDGIIENIKNININIEGNK